MPIQEKNRAWYLPRPKADRYKGGMPLHCEEWLIQEAEEILKKGLKEENILNLFCGMGSHGYRIDIKPEVKPDLIADAHDFVRKVPFGISRQEWKFDLIIADPPYSAEESKELYGTGSLSYKKWTKEADRVLKKGGLLCVYHKYIMPNPDPSKYEVVRRVFVGSRTYHLPRVAIFFRKKPKNSLKAN